MGSGCTSTSAKDNCLDPVSDKCVIYTGPSIEILGICQNDRLNEIEEVILNKLLEYASGEGIVLSEITGNCPFVTESLQNKDKNLFTIIQTILDNQCTLRELIQEVEDNQDTPYPFSLQCLVTPTNPSKDQITQALIDLTCALKTTVDAITDQLENPDNTSLISTINNLVGNFVGSHITSCDSSVVKTGSGADTQLNIVGFVPLEGVIFYDGPTSNFDSTGLGTAAACMTSFAICNGQNGTQDFRGWSLSGATTNVPGSNPLLSQVQAQFFGDTDINTNPGMRRGANKVTISVNQLPNHTHLITDPGHYHIVNDNSIVGGSGNAFPQEGLKQGSGAYVSNLPENTSTNTTGITVGGINRGSINIEEAFQDNRQPTYYGLWIKRIK